MGATPVFADHEASAKEEPPSIIEELAEAEQKESPMKSQERDIRSKLGLGPKEKSKMMEGADGLDGTREQSTRIVEAARRQSAAPSLLERASDFLNGIVSSAQSAARMVINKVKEIGQKVQSFVEDIRRNGVKPLFESVKQRASQAAAILTDPSRLSNAVGRVTERLNHTLQVIPDRIRAVMQALNDRLYGIKREDSKGSGSASESRYWKELTGMTRKQFLLALRKERDRILLLGSVSSQGIDFNAGRTAKQGRGSSSTGLAKIRLVDLLRGNFQGVYHLRMHLAQRIAQKIIDGPLFGEGKLTGSVLDSAVWLQERLAVHQAALGSNIVLFHEAYVTGTTFAEIYRENDSWR